MKQWRNILQRGDDVWTASSRGLDKLALKPEIISEQKPVFRLGYEGGLVFRRELRSEEEFLKDFTPFVNKKTSEYLEEMRKAWFEPNGLDDSIYDMFFGGERTAAEAVREQEEYEHEEEEFIHDDWASLFSGAEEPLSTVASDIRGILERHEPSSEARASVGGGGSVAAAAAAGLPGWARGSLDTKLTSVVGGGAASSGLPIRGYEDLEATRAELERTGPILQQIHTIQEHLVRLRQPPEDGTPRAPLLVASQITRLEGQLVSLYQSMGKTPGEIREMMRASEVELRKVSSEVLESAEYKEWDRFLASKGLLTRQQRVAYARSIGVGPAYIAAGKRTNHAAIIKGLLEAGKRAPPTLATLRAKAAAEKAQAERAGVGPSGGGAGGGGGGPGGGP